MSADRTLVARLVTDEAVHELHCDAGRYILHLYVRECDGDRELTAEEAGEWCDTVLRCGGLVRRQR